MLFPSNAKVGILSPWRIRNDSSYVIVYNSSPDSLAYRVLTPLEASIVPFLDGTSDFPALTSIWHAIHGGRHPTECLETVLEHFGEQLGAVGPRAVPSPSFAEDAARLVPRFSDYILPQRLSLPLAVYLAFSNRCKFKCLYCYAEKATIHEAPLDAWRDFFGHMKRHEIFVGDIIGADLFSREDAVSLLESMVAHDLSFTLSTKSHIDPTLAAKLAELGIGTPSQVPHMSRPLQISLDTVRDEVAHNLLGLELFATNTLQSLKNLMEVGIVPSVKCVLTGLNHAFLPGLLETMVDIGITSLRFVYYSRSHYRHDDKLFLSEDQKHFIQDQALRFQSLHHDVIATFPGDGEMTQSQKQMVWDNRSMCAGGRMAFVVQPNGDVTLCEQIPHQDVYVVGNVFHQDISEIWNSPRMLALAYPARDNFAGATCGSCREFEACMRDKGYCFRESLIAYGSTFEAPPSCPYQTKQGKRLV